MTNLQDDQDRILRYSRQLILKEFGYQGQEKLEKASVLVVGAGGLGSPALLYLAAAGVGTIGIADFDTVGLSNLNRQVIHDTLRIGQKKADSAEEVINRLNPEVKVIKHRKRLEFDNIEEIVADYDVVIDATDNFPARYLVSDCCYFLKKPLIEGAVIGLNGTLMTIIPGKTPCYRCLYPEPPQDGVVPTCNNTGILGPASGTIGTLQALEAIKVLAGMGETLSGRLLVFDGMGLHFQEVEINASEDCPLCGKNPTISELVQYDLRCKLRGIDY